MSQEFRLADDPLTRNRIATLPNINDRFNDVIDVTLREQAVGNGERDQIHRRLNFVARFGIL
jgi:hypothetical protein